MLQHASNTEVAKFHGALAVSGQENVLGLQVSVENSPAERSERCLNSLLYKSHARLAVVTPAFKSPKLEFHGGETSSQGPPVVK